MLRFFTGLWHRQDYILPSKSVVLQNKVYELEAQVMLLKRERDLLTKQLNKTHRELRKIQQLFN
jgi:hypothetical protein